MKKFLPARHRYISNFMFKKSDAQALAGEPQTKRNSAGFTLIELMVVVSIIGILSVVGISLYTGAQKQARDAIRRVEINSLGKSIETSKEPTAGTYTYTSTNYSEDYPQNKPGDPSKVDTLPGYCISTGTTIPATPTTAEWPVTAVCPSLTVLPATVIQYATLITSSSKSFTSTTSTGIAAGVRYWKICARLESSNTITCVQSNNQ